MGISHVDAVGQLDAARSARTSSHTDARLSLDQESPAVRERCLGWNLCQRQHHNGKPTASCVTKSQMGGYKAQHHTCPARLVTFSILLTEGRERFSVF